MNVINILASMLRQLESLSHGDELAEAGVLMVLIAKQLTAR